MVKPKDTSQMLTKKGYVDSEEDLPILTEKVDVYSLGYLLHNLLTGHSPRGQAKKHRVAEVREVVLRGEMPNIHPDILNSTDPATVALRQGAYRCLQYRPEDRWTARDIAMEMLEVLERIKAEELDEEPVEQPDEQPDEEPDDNGE